MSGANETAALQLRQALNRGRLGSDEARSLCEHAPRLVAMLIAGLSPRFGHLTPGAFVELCGRVEITNAILSEAMR